MIKELKIRSMVKISAFNGPTEVITDELIDKIMGPVDNNKMKILEGAMGIESMLDAIIFTYFFEMNSELKDKSLKFRDLVLSSDWCTFSAKKKLVIHIVNEKKLLEGKNKNEFDTILKKIIGYRNAFTHGQFPTDGREVRIEYFEGSNITKTIDNEFFEKIEKDFELCWDMIDRVMIKNQFDFLSDKEKEKITKEYPEVLK